MSWSVEHNPSLGFIVEVFRGIVTASELIEASSKRISLQKETGITKILNDVSEIELEATILDVFNFPSKHYHDDGVDRRTCMALIMPKCDKARELAEFFITSSLNRGWTVQDFNERQSAIDWLQAKTTFR
jgi:hypothetical protein